MHKPGEPEPPRDREDTDQGLSDFARSARNLGPYLQLGWTIAGSVTLGTLLGYWLDTKLGTTPWLLLAGALLGITAGFIELLRLVQKLK